MRQPNRRQRGVPTVSLGPPRFCGANGDIPIGPGRPHDVHRAAIVARGLRENLTPAQMVQQAPQLGLTVHETTLLVERVQKNGGSYLPGLYGCHVNHARKLFPQHIFHLLMLFADAKCGYRKTLQGCCDILYIDWSSFSFLFFKRKRLLRQKNGTLASSREREKWREGGGPKGKSSLKIFF